MCRDSPRNAPSSRTTACVQVWIKVMQLMHILELSPFLCKFTGIEIDPEAALQVPACAITLAHLALTYHTGAARGAAN